MDNILIDVLSKAATVYKFPEILHLPWSPGLPENAKVVSMTEIASTLVGREVVITEKMDGENVSLYHSGFHFKEFSDAVEETEPHREWIRDFWKENCWSLSLNSRICGEYMLPRRKVAYDNLKDYFLVHSMWIGGMCWDWDVTEQFTKGIGMHTVPILWRGKAKSYKHLVKVTEDLLTDKMEGLVVRPTRNLTYNSKRKVPNYMVGIYQLDNPLYVDVDWSLNPDVTNSIMKPIKHYDLSVSDVLGG